MKPLPLTDVQLFEITKMIKNGRIREESVDMAKATRFILQTTEAMAELNSMKVAHMKLPSWWWGGTTRCSRSVHDNHF
jgi:hypothetical protein